MLTFCYWNIGRKCLGKTSYSKQYSENGYWCIFDSSSLNARCQMLPWHCYILFLELRHLCLAWKKPSHFLSSLNGTVLQFSVWEGAAPTHLYYGLCISWALPWTSQFWKDSSYLRLHPSSFGTDGPLQTYKILKTPFTEDFKTCFNADNLDSQYHKQPFLSTLFSKFCEHMVEFHPTESYKLLTREDLDLALQKSFCFVLPLQEHPV